MFFVRALDQDHYVGIRTVRVLADGITWEAKVWSTRYASATWELPTVLAFAALGAGGPADPYGVQVFGPSGQRYFDSTCKPLALEGLFQFNASSVTSGTVGAQSDEVIVMGQTFSAPAISCAGNPWWLLLQQGGAAYQFRKGGIGIDGQFLRRRATRVVYANPLTSGILGWQYVLPAESVAVIDAARYLW